MTTIAYRDGVIAYDSRAVKGDLIATDNYDKHYKRKGWHFFLAGTLCDMDAFVESVISGRESSSELEVEGFAVDPKGVLWDVGGSGWRVMLPDVPRTTGSGASYALAAMDFGCNAKQAVKYAGTRDINTGGKVRTYKLKEYRG